MVDLTWCPLICRYKWGDSNTSRLIRSGSIGYFVLPHLSTQPPPSQLSKTLNYARQTVLCGPLQGILSLLGSYQDFYVAFVGNKHLCEVRMLLLVIPDTLLAMLHGRFLRSPSASRPAKFY